MLILALSVAPFFSGAPAEAQDSPAGDNPAPIPDAAAQAASLKLVRDLFKADYASAKLAPAKLKLSRKLLEQGIETRDNPAARYVLFIEARDLAVDAGDARAALGVVDEIATRYLAVGALDLKAQALEKISKGPRTPGVERGLALSSLELAETALRVGNYPVAKKAAVLGDAIADRAKARHLAAWARYLGRQTADQEKELVAVKAAQAVLQQIRTDPDASLTAGRFRALLKGEWEAGCALIKNGADPVLKALAETELSQPADPSEQSALGDGWFAAAEKLSPPFKAPAQARAVYWYERALEGLQGLTRAQLEDKLSRVAAGSGDLKPGLMAELFEGRGLKRKKKVRVDQQIVFAWGFGSPDKLIPVDRFSIRWTGVIQAPSPGRYTLTFQADDGVRFWLDGELLADHWAVGFHRTQAVAFLTDKPHDLRIEYYEENNPAQITLSWSKDGRAGAIPVPAHALFHDAAAEREAKKP